MERKKLDTINENDFSLESISCTYVQDSDCCQSPEEAPQVIKLETCSNGVGSFIRMSLPEGGFWSVEDDKDIVRLFEDFKSRFGYNETD